MGNKYFKDKTGAHRRTIYKGVGYTDQDLRERPHIGVVNTVADISPAHAHMGKIAEWVKAGIWQGGGVPFEFGTFATCGNVSMGTEHLKYELVIRDVMAASIEIVSQVHLFDGLVLLSSCDSLIPGQLMAAARLNIPSILLTGGPMMGGDCDGETITSADVNEAGVNPAFSEDKLQLMEDCACPGYGACPIMGTANTMQILSEALGLSMWGTGTIPAVSSQRLAAAQKVGNQIVKLVEKGITPRKILTREALLNGVAVDLAIGGSTNAVLHLISLSKELGVELDLNTFDEMSRKVPCLVSVIPNGQHTVVDFHYAGGVPALVNELKDYLQMSCITVDDLNLETLSRGASVKNRKVIYEVNNPLYKEGGLAVLRGNLAPDGAIVRQTAIKPEMLVFKGPARVFTSDQDGLVALQKGEIKPGQVMVIREEGPVGAPGMKEMMLSTDALYSMGLDTSVGLITDGRFSGFNRGPIVGHITPEAALGGPIAVVEDGDIILVDIPNRRLELEISAEEMTSRLKNWKPSPPKTNRGILAAYARLTEPADQGGAFQARF